jgi:aminobenzoyl-glutamate utilization protein B
MDLSKKDAIRWVDANGGLLDEAAKDIWSYAEIAFEERRSSKRLSSLLESQGFQVELGVAGIPMAFIATYGSGKPVVGILGELDALPGLSQKALTAYNIGVNFLREHLKPTVRIHYVIPEAGMAPNVVPDHARVWYYVRDIDRRGVEQVYGRILKIAEGAAIMSNTEHEVYFNSGVYNYLSNREVAQVLHRNLELVGPPEFTDEQQRFARQLQRNLGEEEEGLSTEIEPLEEPKGYSGGGSTDAADVSWIVPTSRIRTACWPVHTPGHSWGVVTCAGSSIGFAGMRTAAKTIAASAVEVLLDPSIIERARAEFEKSTKDFRYESALSPDQKPRIP